MQTSLAKAVTITTERQLCETYLRRCQDEQPLTEAITRLGNGITLLVAEGFEERSLGVLETLYRSGARLNRVLIGRYETADNLNAVYRKRHERLAQSLAPNEWKIVPNANDGCWIKEAMREAPDPVVLDITSISNRAMFSSLDAAASLGKGVCLAYTEAREYWPKRSNWRRLKRELKVHQSLAELVDTQPWLFSYEHRVELIGGHEGYDTAGTGRALVAFLPYKCARLAAVLAVEDYADFVFIAGIPPDQRKHWRVDALKEINESLIKRWPVIEMKTFGYRGALRDLMNLLLEEESLLWKYDVHFASMGSKLQTVASWLFSCFVPSITMITSVPSRYYREAFSEGIGNSWLFELIPPASVQGSH
jgi:hypothetical protein